MAFLKYTLIRLALFAPLFALFLYLQLGVLLAALCAGMMSFAVSFLFFQKQRDAATATLHHRFSGKAKPMRSAGEVADAAAEDRLVDANPDIAVRTDNRPEDSREPLAEPRADSPAAPGSRGSEPRLTRANPRLRTRG